MFFPRFEMQYLKGARGVVSGIVVRCRKYVLSFAGAKIHDFELRDRSCLDRHSPSHLATPSYVASLDMATCRKCCIASV